MLEYCRFSYKAFAQSLYFPFDPFFESWGPGLKVLPSARDRLMEHLHKEVGTTGDECKFDPVEYLLKTTPNPHHSVIYRGGTDNKYILFQPRDLDTQISDAKCFDLQGSQVDGGATIVGKTGRMRCGYFHGRTGMTQNHPSSGWTTLLGAVIYNPAHKSATIVFRGSRSGSGERALLQAQTKSKGSADWVTDMNHLKGVAVDKYDGNTMACGFHYAYESCRKSLAAAIRYAVSGELSAIYVTGHSLGGALAQCAYLDLACGDIVTSLDARDGSVGMYCYPISAPPVCHGAKAQHWFSFHGGAANVHHYYCPKDAVHASPLVTGSLHTRLNGFVHTFTHPLTDPAHIGAEIALECDAAFPDAHEPEEVWKGMKAGTSDPKFWPTFELDVVRDVSTVKGLPSGLEGNLHDALQCGILSGAAIDRAADWLAVTKSSSRQALLSDGIKLYTKACEVLNAYEPGMVGSPEAMTVKDSVKTARRALIDGGYKDPSSHSASSSAYWTLLSDLAARQVVKFGG